MLKALERENWKRVFYGAVMLSDMEVHLNWTPTKF